MQKKVFLFFEKCLPQSGRVFEPEGRHKILKDIDAYYDYFLCLMDDDEIAGTVALKKINNQKCELRSLYLLEKYHGKGYGKKLMQNFLSFAKEKGYSEILLDTIEADSKKAIGLYKRLGFVETEKYKETEFSDVFMKLML
ncbi:MAG TPA: GNAT family N-acetyltransferase [Spirochaetota bacterium]|nr:GNAT family N-acetyltransferase [Spirochaetota bacterium]HOR44436.1 GNAT family N-acetyltransferase [Spirochaetota bacterium]HOU84621.1 GNAT family N-acetyltransferase [Spirochaetota bacterium]HPK55872.1 GNAT family N-acetyltransferase [Spirochaetota bacterium]HQE57633.1 GNAT family N-acetyltransferase [Spirochaetota bacterium]